MEEYTDARLVARHQLLANQTLLVNKMLQSGYLSWNDPENDVQGNSREIFEWWLVKPTLAAKLLDENELVVTGYGNRWWGRTTTGAPVYQDEVIGEIAASFYTDPDEDPTRKKFWW